MSSEYCLVLCTCPDSQAADAIAAKLVDAGLAACVNIVPGLRSVYIWKGARETAQEHLLIIKSRKAAYAGIETAILSLHPYELPEVISVPIEAGLPAYLQWIGESTRHGA